MNKMKDVDGQLYSRQEFCNYQIRAKLRFKVSEDWRDDRVMDVYTTETNKDKFKEVIEDMRNPDYSISFEVEGWTTKAQDDLTAKFIDETLKDI